MAESNSFLANLRHYAVVSRWEFLPSVVLFVTIPAVLAISDGADIRAHTWSLFWGFVVFVLAYLIGSKINCIADFELDREFKSHLHEGVASLGKPLLWALVALESAIATTIVVYLSWSLGRWVLLGLWITGYVLAFMYSVEPFRLKRRGLANVFTLLLVLTFLPPLFIYLILRDTLGFTSLMVLAVFNVQIAATVLINEIEDYPEDRAHGVLNPCVLWGIEKTAFISMILMVVGAIALFGIAIAYAPGLWWVSLIAFTVGYYPVVKPFVTMYQLCHAQTVAATDERLDEIRALGRKLPVWLIWMGVPITVTLILALLGKDNTC